MITTFFYCYLFGAHKTFLIDENNVKVITGKKAERTKRSTFEIRVVLEWREKKIMRERERQRHNMYIIQGKEKSKQKSESEIAESSLSPRTV